MDPQTDLYGNTIHQDLGGSSYIHDGYGQRRYLDEPSPSSSSGSSGGGSSGGGGGGGGDWNSSDGGGSSGGGGGGGGGSSAGAGCSSILVLGLLGMCVCSGIGNWLSPRRPTVNVPVKRPLPIATPRQKSPTVTTSSTPSKSPAASPGQTQTPNPPTPSSNAIETSDSDQTWHGKLQLVERHQRTGAVKNSSKWTDLKLALKRSGDDVTGEVHFIEAGVTATVRGRITEPAIMLVIERVTSGPAAAVIVPCVLSGQPDAKRVFRGHWNQGVIGKDATSNPRFWLSEGTP